MKSIRIVNLVAPALLFLMMAMAVAVAARAEPAAGAEPATKTEPATGAEPATDDATQPEIPAQPANVTVRDSQADLLERPGRTPLRLPPMLGSLNIPIGFAGYFWVDTGYMWRKNAREGQYDQNAAYMQGRFVLAAQYYKTFRSMFATAKVEFIGFVNEFSKSQFEPHVLDAYVMVGGDWWDVQVGRFLAWEIYHRGQGIELYTAEEAGALGGPSLYWLDAARGHMNESGQAALHFYVGKTLGIEIAGVYGQESNQNKFGVRPAFDLRFWDMQLLLGYEFLTQRPQTDADKVMLTSHGYAAQLAYHGRYFSIGADWAQRWVDYLDLQGLVDGDKTFDKYSVGGYMDFNFWKNSIGLGYHFTYQQNEAGEEDVHHQAFVSYLINLPFEGLSLKAVYGYAWAHVQDISADSEWANSMHSFRVRISYTFD